MYLHEICTISLDSSFPSAFMVQIYFFYIKTLERPLYKELQSNVRFYCIVREKTLITLCDRWQELVSYFGFVCPMFVNWLGESNFSPICSSSIAKFRRMHWFYYILLLVAELEVDLTLTGCNAQFTFRTPEFGCWPESKYPSSVVIWSMQLGDCLGVAPTGCVEKEFSLPICRLLHGTAQLS